MGIHNLKDHKAAFVSVGETAEYLGVSDRHLHREIIKGALPARRFGRCLRVLTEDFRRYVGSTEPK